MQAQPRSPILVAYDLGPGGQRALQAAHALAKDLGCGILLAHAFDRMPAIDRAAGAEALGERATERVARLETEDALRLTAEAAAPLRADGVEVEVVAREGIAWELALEEAQRRGCPMVVVGTAGRSGLQALWHGSVARTVLHRSGVPVLVVPERLGQAPAASAPHRILLVATDFSPASDAAVDAGFLLARDLRAKARLLHVVEVRPTLGSLPEEVRPRLDEAEAAAAAEAALEASRARGLHVAVTPAVRMGQPADLILDEARACGATCIVVGTHGRGALARFLLGSVAQELIQRSDRPVLVVPNPAAPPRGDWIR